ncbi:MAG: PD-(D/E)XK nuclease family protein, partial [Desulfobaccales bacterium]
SRRPARTPSESKSGEVTGGRIFALEGNGAAGFGRSVHNLLAQVEWGGTQETARLAAVWRNEGSAGTEALACVRAPALAEIWSKPAAGRVEVWRERAFEIVLDGVWFTGVFDRVVVERDESSRAVRAWVLDYKTGRDGVAQVVERHAGQLNLYRRVAAVLTGLPVQMVRCSLVLTDGCLAVDVPQTH